MSVNKRVVQMMCVALVGVMAWPAAAHAQRRGRGRVVAVRPVVVAPYVYSPYYYDPFFWGGWNYPGQYPPGFYGRRYQLEGNARVQVTPRETEVYVDGYLAGVADDFDGIFQRLRVEPGEHVIELYLDGYHSITQNILFAPGATMRIRHVMEPLGPGDAPPARPTPAGMPAPPSGPSTIYDAFGRPDPSMAPARQASAAAGTLVIRVQPADAVVLVDGERWQTSSAGDRLEIQVAPGSHRIEVRKEGYAPFLTVVDVAPGGTAPVNISLSRAGGEEER